MAEATVEHHKASNNIIIISLIVASAILIGSLLFLCGLWFYRLNRLKNSTEKNTGTTTQFVLPMECSGSFVFNCMSF